MKRTKAKQKTTAPKPSKVSCRLKIETKEKGPIKDIATGLCQTIEWDLSNEQYLDVFTDQVAQRMKSRGMKRWINLCDSIDPQKDKLMLCRRGYLKRNWHDFLQPNAGPDSDQASEKNCSSASPRQSI